MASVYKFKRKGKDESEMHSASVDTLFETEGQNDESTKPEQTQDKNTEEEKESTTIFTPFEEKKNDIPQELLDSFAAPKADFDKLDAVFNHTRGTVSADTSKEEYDETTDLLKEIFGSAEKDKKKKKKESEEAVLESAPEEAGDEYVADHAGGEEVTRDYIAIHDGDEEKTKEYAGTFTAEDVLAGQDLETRVDLPPVVDEFNAASSDTDDLYSDTYEELEQKKAPKTILPEEYTAPDQYDEFAEHLRSKNFRNLCTALWSFLAFLLLVYLESATFSKLYHPVFLKPGGMYNIIYLLVDIQLIFISALLILPSLGDGLKTLFRGKPNRNSVVFFVHLFPAIHALILLITSTKEYPLFGSLAGLFAFLAATANFLDSKRLYRTFRVCARKGDKFVAKKVGADSPEGETFREQLEGEPSFFSIQKASFVENFFERSKMQGKVESSFAWVLFLAGLASLAFGVYSWWKEPNLASAATGFMTMAAMTFPLSCIFTISLPFSHISAKAERSGAAIISTAAAEEYAAADVVSFTDKEIFPPKSVKVTTIRTYGSTRIDKAILYAAMIFQKLGGPLSEVFKKTISGVCQELSEDFDFLEITADGMCAKIDEMDIFVGNKDYLLSYDFGYTKDEQDAAFEAKHGKIMYMVIGGELAAKFYIRYCISKQFKKTVLSLYRSGICPAVKTCDPNIDTELFRTLLQNKKIPAGIIKSCEAMKDAPVAETSDSGVVCVSSIAKLLQTFSLCEALRHLMRANVIMKLLSLVLGAGIVVFLFSIESLTKVNGLFALIYQLLWIIPVTIPSLTE